MKFLILSLFLSNMSMAADLLIEHQVRLCDSDTNIKKAFNLKSIDKKFLQKIYYLETLDHNFQKQGWSLRFRERTDEVELTLKHRTKSYITNPPLLKNIECEFDSHGVSKEYACKVNIKFSISRFKKIINNELDWKELLSNQELEWLNESQLDLNSALIFGTLLNERFSFDHKLFGKVTLDIVHPNNDFNTSFNEVSIRYKESEATQLSTHFNNYLNLQAVSTCSNQLDWETDKFTVLSVLN